MRKYQISDRFYGWRVVFVVPFFISQAGMCGIIQTQVSHLQDRLLPLTKVTTTLGPMVSGIVYDTQRNYSLTFVCFLVFFIVSIPIALLIKKVNVEYAT